VKMEKISVLRSMQKKKHHQDVVVVGTVNKTIS